MPLKSQIKSITYHVFTASVIGITGFNALVKDASAVTLNSTPIGEAFLFSSSGVSVNNNSVAPGTEAITGADSTILTDGIDFTLSNSFENRVSGNDAPIFDGFRQTLIQPAEVQAIGQTNIGTQPRPIVDITNSVRSQPGIIRSENFRLGERTSDIESGLSDIVTRGIVSSEQVASVTYQVRTNFIGNGPAPNQITINFGYLASIMSEITDRVEVDEFLGFSDASIIVENGFGLSVRSDRELFNVEDTVLTRNFFDPSAEVFDLIFDEGESSITSVGSVTANLEGDLESGFFADLDVNLSAFSNVRIQAGVSAEDRVAVENQIIADPFFFIDPTSGLADQFSFAFSEGIGNEPFNIDGPVAAVSLPETIPLFITALGSFGFWNWRRRKII